MLQGICCKEHNYIYSTPFGNRVKQLQTEIVAIQSNNQSDFSSSVISQEGSSVVETNEDGLNAEIPIQAPIMKATESKHAGQAILNVSNRYLFSIFQQLVLV